MASGLLSPKGLFVQTPSRRRPRSVARAALAYWTAKTRALLGFRACKCHLEDITSNSASSASVGCERLAPLRTDRHRLHRQIGQLDLTNITDSAIRRSVYRLSVIAERLGKTDLAGYGFGDVDDFDNSPDCFSEDEFCSSPAHSTTDYQIVDDRPLCDDQYLKHVPARTASSCAQHGCSGHEVQVGLCTQCQILEDELGDINFPRDVGSDSYDDSEGCSTPYITPSSSPIPSEATSDLECYPEVGLSRGRDQPKKKRPTITDIATVHIVDSPLDYDRCGDKPWLRLTAGDKFRIKRELNCFKRDEMPVHRDSIDNTRYHK